MLVKTHPFDIVPCSGLMAFIALIHQCFFLPGNFLRQHGEVLPVMTGWGLVALVAQHRTHRWMLKGWNSPLQSRMAGSAIQPKQSIVFVFGAVATGTIQIGLYAGHKRVSFR